MMMMATMMSTRVVMMVDERDSTWIAMILARNAPFFTESTSQKAKNKIFTPMEESSGRTRPRVLVGITVIAVRKVVVYLVVAVISGCCDRDAAGPTSTRETKAFCGVKLVEMTLTRHRSDTL